MNQVDQYIDNQSTSKAITLNTIRSLVLNLSPLVEEKFSYQCPFYYLRKKPFVYMGVNKSYAYNVVLGFCKGSQLSNAHHILEGEGKVVRHIVFREQPSIPLEIVQQTLHEALILHEKTTN